MHFTFNCIGVGLLYSSCFHTIGV